MGKKNKAVVVVTGASHPTGLGIARALAPLSCDIIGLYGGQKTRCCKSRCWKQLIHFRTDEEVIDILLKLASSQPDRPALFIVQDSLVKLVSDNRDLLAPHYKFLLPEKETVDLFLSKTKFQDWAEKNQLPIPMSRICQSRKELDEAIRTTPRPLIIKPAHKTPEWEKWFSWHKALRVDKSSDLSGLKVDPFEIVPELIVQQWVPGPDKNVFFCLIYYGESGTEVAHFTGRKLFQWPPYCGSTAAAVGVDNQEVYRITKELFDKVRYRGLGSLELKFHESESKFYIIEPTVGRCDLQSNVAVSGGINLAGLALCDAEGWEWSVRKRGRAAWIHEESLVDSLRFYSREGCVHWRSLLRLLTVFCKFAFFSVKDPCPFFLLLKEELLKKTSM